MTHSKEMNALAHKSMRTPNGNTPAASAARVGFRTTPAARVPIKTYRATTEQQAGGYTQVSSRPWARTKPTRQPRPTAPSTAPTLNKIAANIISGHNTRDTKQIITADSRHSKRGRLWRCRTAPAIAAPNARARVRVNIYSTAGRNLPPAKSTMATTLIMTKNRSAPTHKIRPALQ